MTSAEINQATPPVIPYDQLGGAAAVRQLVDDFYDEMQRAPEAKSLRAMHAADLSPMRQILFEFLSGWLGGPRTYWERSDHKCMVSAHAALPITKELAQQWMQCMQKALDKLPADAGVRTLVSDALHRAAHGLVRS